MRWLAIAAVLVAFGCGDKYPVAQLEDPNTCKTCHPKHFDQWSGSMHAYASDDPVFLAMNKRGQRETGGQLGSFCVQCHAPMAVALHPNDDFSSFDPSTRPPAERGITCFFCHDVDSVKADHNNGLVLALDQTMRGGLKNAADTPAHESLYDPMMHGKTNQSKACGSCHDVVTPQHMVQLERTYVEWQGSVFSHDDPDPSHALPQTCSTCHMISSTEPIAEGPGLDVGSHDFGFHDHTWPAIDQALTDFPNKDAQAAGIDGILKGSLNIIGPTPAGGTDNPPGGLCLEPVGGGQIRVRVDTLQIGHMFPSGAAQDRRAWVELVAFDASNNKVFSSGEVPAGVDPDATNDPFVNCTMPGMTSCSGFWDRIYKDDDSEAHFFWEVARVDSHLVRPPITLVSTEQGYDHSTTVIYPVPGISAQIDHMTARVLIRPLNFAMLDDLVATGDLDAAIAAQLPTLVAKGTVKTWSRATAIPATGCNPNP